MKILICDKHEIVRLGIKHLLQQLPGLLSIDEASDGQEAFVKLENSDFDIVILSALLPGISGLEVLEVIKTKWKSVNVLMHSMNPKDQSTICAFKLGASGYMSNDLAPEELLEAVKRISEGRKYISHSLDDSVAHYFVNEANTLKHSILSNREYVTMIKLANGKSVKEIGKELYISNKTVSTYRTRLMRKMELENNTEITKYCISNELI